MWKWFTSSEKKITFILPKATTSSHSVCSLCAFYWTLFVLYCEPLQNWRWTTMAKKCCFAGCQMGNNVNNNLLCCMFTVFQLWTGIFTTLVLPLYYHVLWNTILLLMDFKYVTCLTSFEIGDLNYKLTCIFHKVGYAPQRSVAFLPDC